MANFRTSTHSISLSCCSFPPAAEIFPQFISATWGCNGPLGLSVAPVFGGVHVGVDAKGGCWTLAVSAELGTRTHLALMLLGCPAVRVRGATRPHPFKASPGKRPLLKAPAQHEGGAQFFFFFSPFCPPRQSAVNLWKGRSADTTLSPRVVDMETETQRQRAKTDMWGSGRKYQWPMRKKMM